MPLQQILAIARNTFIEAVRQPVFFFLIVAAGILQVFNTWNSNFSMGLIESAEVSADTSLLLDVGLATIFGCGVLLAAFIATATISREIEHKTILTVVSKPVPRLSIVLGKYLGVSLAIAMATTVMLIFMLLSIRHGVLSTAADRPDQPVILFSFIGAMLTFGVAGWCNYFYGWSFSQTGSILVLPVFIVVYGLVLAIGKKWEWQPLHTDFKPMVTLATGVVGLGILVLTSVAVAASTRLGQVMTIVVCAGIFLLGLLSNHLLGRHAMHNDLVGLVREATVVRAVEEGFSNPGATAEILLESPPGADLKPDDTIYYGSNPNGYDLVPPPFAQHANPLPEDQARDPREPAIRVISIDGRRLVIAQTGLEAVPVSRPPENGDSLFLRPTTYNPVAFGLWAVFPNLQFFWLLDAVVQNRAIPFTHAAMVVLYALMLIGAFLSLAAALFAKRSVA